MFTNNLILAGDSYKAGHFKLNNPDVQFMYNYIESRGGEFKENLFYGLQMYIKEYLSNPITRENIEEAAEMFGLHGVPFNRDGWEIILNEHGGFLPIEIWAAPEGLRIPTHNILVSTVNTDSRLPWVTGYGETARLRGVWYPTTVCSLDWYIKQDIRAALEVTCDNPEAEHLYRLHDFGGRAATSGESAGIGGSAHLVNFMGTDTFEGIVAAKRYYGEPMAGHSIVATEHSNILSFGKGGELRAFERLMDVFEKPGTIAACVSDTYDLFGAIKNYWGGALKERIINSGGTLVVRPDSGDPTIIPVQVIELLADIFSYTINTKGYKVLPHCVRVIQGDGVNRQSIKIIMKNLMDKGFSVENLAFGMGGALLQILNRDTNKFAEKTSAIYIDGEWIGVAKDPITDPGKRSKMGRLALVQGDNGLETVPLEGNESRNIMKCVWRNGELLVDHKFSDIRQRSNQN